MNLSLSLLFTCACLSAALSGTSFASDTVWDGLVPYSTLTPEDLLQVGPKPEDYQWWEQDRFGIFIHWGPGSLLKLHGGGWQREVRPESKNRFIGISESTPGEIPEAIQDGSYMKYTRKSNVPLEIYDNLYQIFNPKEFDADAWVQKIKAAGAHYIVFTAKHHDGFAMWDTKFTEYNIMNTPFGRDICKELSEACQKHGIKLFWYYSIADWTDERYNLETRDPAYKEVYMGQLRELAENYGKIDGFWWDGGMYSTDAFEIFHLLDQLQPGYICNGRVNGRTRTIQLNGKNRNVKPLVYSSPEQRLGEFNMEEHWETCAVMQAGEWFYFGADDLKTPERITRYLIDAACGDGNLLLDFGPDELGRIPEGIQTNLSVMGEYLEDIGPGIYNTRGGPYKPSLWGGSTRRGNSIYLHITQQWPGGAITLPALPVKITSASSFTGGNVSVKQTEETLTLHLDKKYHHPVDTVIVLEIEGDSMELDAIDTRHFVGGMVSIDAAASASSMNHSSGKGNPGAVIYGSDEAEEIELYYGEAAEYIDQETIGEKKIVQKKEFKTNKHRKKGKWGNTHGHHWRYWAAKPDDITPWIEVDLGKPKWVGRIVMQEKCSRITGYAVKILKGEEWVTVAEGTSLGMFNLKLPEAVLTQKVRLQVTDSTPVQGSLHEGAAIHTFDIFGPDPIHTEPGAQP